jgi:hypothetical protein
MSSTDPVGDPSRQRVSPLPELSAERAAAEAASRSEREHRWPNKPCQHQDVPAPAKNATTIAGRPCPPQTTFVVEAKQLHHPQIVDGEENVKEWDLRLSSNDRALLQVRNLPVRSSCALDAIVDTDGTNVGRKCSQAQEMMDALVSTGFGSIEVLGNDDRPQRGRSQESGNELL